MTPTLAIIQLVIDMEAAPVPFLMTDVHMTLMDLATKAAKHRKVRECFALESIDRPANLRYHVNALH